MDLGLKGKVAVVAASSSGLGFATAEALAREGAHLAICSRDRDRIREAATVLKTTYDIEVLNAVCDVTDSKSVKAFQEQVVDRFGKYHILFANAGGPPGGGIETFNLTDIRKAVDLNLFSTVNLVEHFLPVMKSQQWGRIIALASITVKQPLPTLALSNISRVGVVAYIKTLSQAVAALNITANVVAPGYFITGRVKELIEKQAHERDLDYDQALKNLLASIPANKTGNPIDFGSLVAFLASEQAQYITGDTILIDGGMYQGLM